MSSSQQQQQQQQGQVAPFVAKTYQMVSDPRTDELIRWGRGNNSFLVLDPAEFSQFLLPSYFKHCNFSSFVRQLNTYGFRKVDPDIWEFAHESFLRGQGHLLPLIVRRRKKVEEGAGERINEWINEEEEEDDVLLQEIGSLRREQRALDEELQGMDRRLQATERRPHQMMSFLAKVAEDPDLLPRLINSKKEQQQQKQKALLAGDKKRRLITASSSSSSSSSSSLLAPPPPPPPPMVMNQGEVPCFELISPSLFELSGHCCLDSEIQFPAATSDAANVNPAAAFEASQVFYQPELDYVPEPSPVAYPFSLLGHGFI